MAEIGAPRTYSQSSRKSKAAWRKNIDIDDIVAGTEAAREEKDLTGAAFADAPSDKLFQTDTTGSASIQQVVRSSGHGLKADQILAQRSRVPAVDTHVRSGSAQRRVANGLDSGKRKRKSGVSYQELQRLKRVAYAGEALKENASLVDQPASYDPWDVPAPTLPQASETYIEQREPFCEPRSLRQAPRSLVASEKRVPNLRKPSGAQSYNPTFPEYSALLQREGDREVAAERERLRLAEEEAAREARLAEVAARVEKENEEAAMLSAYESEWEGIASASEPDESMLKQKRPRRKTPVERNRADRRKAQERAERQQRHARERDQQEKRLEQILQNTKDAQALAEWAGFNSDADSEDEEVLRKRRLRHRVPLPEKHLELVLPDELQDSLRRLRPEGNILREKFRNMMLQGKLEVRRPAYRRAAKNRKATEKWSYKDWSLDKR